MFGMRCGRSPAFTVTAAKAEAARPRLVRLALPIDRRGRSCGISCGTKRHEIVIHRPYKVVCLFKSVTADLTLATAIRTRCAGAAAKSLQLRRGFIGGGAGLCTLRGVTRRPTSTLNLFAMEAEPAD